MKQIQLFVPDADDLWYRAKCMAEPKTMEYNAGYEVSYAGYDYQTGCIDFPKANWESWHKEKMGNKNFFYAYILDTEKDEFVGYVNFNKDAQTGKATMGIVIQDKYRGKGYMRPAMQQLIETAKSKGVVSLTNTVPTTRKKALDVFYDMGFVKTGQILCEKFKMPERVEEIELVL